MKDLKEIKQDAKPCPFCGGTDLQFICEISRGHGDCGFQHARIVCKSCGGSKGNGYGWGEPTNEDKVKAYLQWNERDNERVFSIEKDLKSAYSLGKETIEYEWHLLEFCDEEDNCKHLKKPITLEDFIKQLNTGTGEPNTK